MNVSILLHTHSYVNESKVRIAMIPDGRRLLPGPAVTFLPSDLSPFLPPSLRMSEYQKDSE